MPGKIVIVKAQQAEVFQGTTNLGTFQPAIGSNPPFGTTSIEVADGGGILSLKFNTNFTGLFLTNGDCFGSQCARVADIALSTDGGQTYGYGISLGYTVGRKSIGLYKVDSWYTSQDVWAPAGSGFQYGGKWETCAGAASCTDANAQLANVVINTGTLIGSASVTDGGSFLSVIASDAAIGSELTALFWGTGDCANDPIAGHIPEPASLAVLGLGFAMTGGIARRNRRSAA